MLMYLPALTLNPITKLWNCLNRFPNKPLFFYVCSRSPLKTLGNGEIARNSVFKPFDEPSSIFIKLKLLSANSFSLEECKICRLGKG